MYTMQNPVQARNVVLERFKYWGEGASLYFFVLFKGFLQIYFRDPTMGSGAKDTLPPISIGGGGSFYAYAAHA